MSENIKSIELLRLRNAEYIQFLGDNFSIISSNNAKALNVEKTFEIFNTKRKDLEQMFKKFSENPVTATIEALDVKRDNAISGIQMVINGYSRHYDTKIVGAANILNANLKRYNGSIAQENYNAETALLNNIINDWENKPELVNALKELNLGTWIDILKEANTSFNAQYISRTQDMAKANPDNLKAKRFETNAAYYNLRDTVVAHSFITPSDLYSKTINEMNALISQYNSLLTGRVNIPPPAKV